MLKEQSTLKPVERQMKFEYITNEIPLIPLDDGKHWKTTCTIEFEEYTVYSGYISDLASSPWFVWWIIPPHGKYSKAAIVHDYIYENKLCSRKKADAVFLRAMEVLNVAKWKRVAMYRAVRIFGWWWWHGKSWANVIRSIKSEI